MIFAEVRGIQVDALNGEVDQTKHNPTRLYI